MRFKKTAWFNTLTNKSVYGIKVKYNCMPEYANVAINGKPALFDTELERDQKIQEIKKDPSAKEFDARVKMIKVKPRLAMSLAACQLSGNDENTSIMAPRNNW